MLKANFFFFFFFFFFFLQCLTGFNKFWEFHYNLFGQEIELTLLWVHIIVFAQKLAFWIFWLSLYLFLDSFGPKGNQLVWHIFIHIATCHVGWCDSRHAFLVKPRSYIYIYIISLVQIWYDTHLFTLPPVMWKWCDARHAFLVKSRSSLYINKKKGPLCIYILWIVTINSDFFYYS